MQVSPNALHSTLHRFRFRVCSHQEGGRRLGFGARPLALLHWCDSVSPQKCISRGASTGATAFVRIPGKQSRRRATARRYLPSHTACQNARWLHTGCMHGAWMPCAWQLAAHDTRHHAHATHAPHDAPCGTGQLCLFQRNPTSPLTSSLLRSSLLHMLALTAVGDEVTDGVFEQVAADRAEMIGVARHRLHQPPVRVKHVPHHVVFWQESHGPVVRRVVHLPPLCRVRARE